MPSWRCPHCSTPQAEASRCWVCHRSSTSCGTCRHFRGSVAARYGFCGLDRRREPLLGDEVRACWEDGAVALEPEPPLPGLLDLLTVRAIGEPTGPTGPTGSEETAPTLRRTVRSADPDAAARRLWVEVEV